MTGHERVELRHRLADDVDAFTASIWPMLEAAFLAGESEVRKDVAQTAYANARASAPSWHHWTDEIRATKEALEAADELETAAYDADQEALKACRTAMMELWMKARKAGTSA